MRDEERGKVRNPEFSCQVIDFSGLRWGKITRLDRATMFWNADNCG